MPKRWADWEDKRLRELAAHCAASEIAAFLLGRSTAAVRNRAKRLGVDLLPKLSDPEKHMLADIKRVGLPLPVVHYQFNEDREWEFDAAYPAHRLAYEVEGGTWMRTRNGRSAGHAHPVRFEQDAEKYNAAEMMKWTLLRFTPNMVKDGRAIMTLQQALAPRPPESEALKVTLDIGETKPWNCEACNVKLGLATETGHLVVDGIYIENGKLICRNCGTVKTWVKSDKTLDRLVRRVCERGKGDA
jgi:hypothetical protein